MSFIELIGFGIAISVAGFIFSPNVRSSTNKVHLQAGQNQPTTDPNYAFDITNKFANLLFLVLKPFIYVKMSLSKLGT